MVTCKLQGGLGNQLFQIAAAMGYSRLHNIPVYMPASTSRPDLWPCYIDHLPELPGGDLPPGTVLYTDPSYHYTAIPIHSDICLICDDGTRGYFQSYKYFDHCRAEILQAFNVPYLKRTGAVSVHVRRGDYLNFPQMHPVITEEYLKKSINFFLNKGIEKFVFFSDDITWCRKFVRMAPFDPTLVEFSEKKAPLHDLSEMCSCEHHIIANSSFSWWGAWLNRNPNKIIVAPNKWFGPEMIYTTKDLLPDSWVKMDSNGGILCSYNG